MKNYIVGGWVRDRMLERQGRAIAHGGDRDWVVVGSSPQEMIALGYQPVGRDFPVFLHPQTREEYALARTERKTAPGYRGFVVHAAPDVTLEQDLQRRDLTINAMALDEQGQLIDPYNGMADLRGRVLRHVGPAFVEDPVRILRLARFAARFADFCVAAQTVALARQMIAAGETDALVPERVWQELARGLMEEHPARMLEVLIDTGLLARLAPELVITPALLEALNRSAPAAAPLGVRFAVLCSAARSDSGLRAWLERLRADGESAQLARLLFELRAQLREARAPEQRARVLERADAWRRPARFTHLLQAFELLEGAAAIDAWRVAAAAAAGIDAGAIAAGAGPDPAAIAQAIAAARRAAIAAVLGKTGQGGASSGSS
jgi:tRNA nucleotidyltransferase (CCA-adding enzyme)